MTMAMKATSPTSLTIPELLAGAGRIVASLSSGETGDVAFTSVGDGASDGPDVASVGLFTTTQQLSSSGAEGVVLTALVKDGNNNLIEGANVQFSSNSGELQVTKSTTGEDGKATAVLNTELDKSNRTIQVTATSNNVNDILDVFVVGTSINISGTSTLAIGDENSFIVKLLDSDGNGIGGQEIALSTLSSGSATISLPDTVTTDANGQGTVLVTGSSGGSNAIVATALGATSQKDITVQADSFLFNSFNNGNGSVINPSAGAEPADVLLSDIATVQLTWLRSGQPVPDGTVVNFTTTRGSLVANSGTTVDGKVTAQVTSNNAGKALLTFVGVEGNVSLENQIEFEFVAETPATVVAQASPDSIGPNGQQSTISVTVKDANGNLVKNQTVEFSLTDTSNGSIFPASAVTDSNGIASTVYTSSSVSARDGVQIEAKVSGTNITDIVTLTVSDRELFISLGTGNKLIEVDSTTYNKQYTVFVVDADSTPRPNVTLTISAIPKDFHKGFWYRYYEDGTFKRWATDIQDTCYNEDLNIDGIMDSGEDRNGDGMLTPGNVVGATGEVTTDDQGRAVIDILYPQSYGSWVDVTLIAKTKVTGTEGSALVTFTLPTLAAHLNDENVTPPVANTGLSSPFGRLPGCTNFN
jgi:protocatechuate 3,4-dioxygenase beta subunit